MMKQFLKSQFLPAAAVILGLVGLGLHQLLYVAAVDARGLPVAGHPLTWLLALLSLGALVLITAGVFPLKGTGDYQINFPDGRKQALGDLVMAGCTLATVMFQPCAMPGGMAQGWRWLGLAAALALIWVGLSRYGGKVPNWGLYLPVCLFLGIHIVSHYRVWSGTSQIRSYVFPLLGGMTLLFFAYYHMSFSVGFPRRRMLLGTGLLTLYLGTVGLLDTAYRVLWLGSLFWVYSNLCACQVPPEEEKQVPPKEGADT